MADSFLHASVREDRGHRFEKGLCLRPTVIPAVKGTLQAAATSGRWLSTITGSIADMTNIRAGWTRTGALRGFAEHEPEENERSAAIAEAGGFDGGFRAGAKYASGPEREDRLKHTGQRILQWSMKMDAVGHDPDVEEARLSEIVERLLRLFGDAL